MRPMPIPALNIIATHETVLNSGCSSWPPSRIFPYLLKARYSEKTKKPKDDSMKTQPKLGTRKLHKTALKTAAKLFVKRIPHATNTAERTAAIQNTVGSILGLVGLSITNDSFPIPLSSCFIYIVRNTQALYLIVQRVSSCEKRHEANVRRRTLSVAKGIIR